MKGKIHIGTFGWHYKHWIGTFYPKDTKDDQQLVYYLNFFKTVELNNPFYHLPPPQTLRNGKKSVPDDFVSAVKASRYITHVKKLKVEKENVKLFFASANKLRKKLGPAFSTATAMEDKSRTTGKISQTSSQKISVRF